MQFCPPIYRKTKWYRRWIKCVNVIGYWKLVAGVTPLSLAMETILSAKSWNILTSCVSFALPKLLRLTFLPKPRWWKDDLNGIMETIRSRSPSRLDSCPNRSTFKWFQQVKLFTYLLPSYFLTRHSKYFLGRKSTSCANTYLPWFIPTLLNVCLQFVSWRKGSRFKTSEWL